MHLAALPALQLHAHPRGASPARRQPNDGAGRLLPQLGTQPGERGGGGEGVPLPQLGPSQKLPGLVSAFFFITPTNLYPPILQLHIAYAPPPPISLPLLCFTLPCMRALQEDWVATILIAMNLRSPMKGAPS